MVFLFTKKCRSLGTQKTVKRNKFTEGSGEFVCLFSKYYGSIGTQKPQIRNTPDQQQGRSRRGGGNAAEYMIRVQPLL